MTRFTHTYSGRWVLGLLLSLLPLATAAQQPVISRVYVTDTPGQDSVFQLGNTIALEVTGLNRWLKAQEALLLSQGFDLNKAHAKARELVLYVDDAPILNMPPIALYVDESSADKVLTAAARRAAPTPGAAPDSSGTAPAPRTPEMSSLYEEFPVGMPDKVIFKLERNVRNYRYWDVVYSSPWNYSHTGKIGLGYDDRLFTKLHPHRPSSAIRLELIQPATLWVAVLGTISLGLALLLLGRRTGMFRVVQSRPTTPPAPPALAPTLLPFSIAKVQMAWWTFLILGSFLVIYCVSGEMPEISTTSLALLGISGGTAALNGLIPRTPHPTVSAGTTLAPSRGWLTDILSDEQGLSMNRLQQVVISLLMGYFFVRTVYNSVAMPVWTDNQILLLAVSSATYLSLEWQSNRPAPPVAAPAQSGNPGFASVPLPDGVAPSPAGQAPIIVAPIAITSPPAAPPAANADEANPDNPAVTPSA